MKVTYDAAADAAYIYLTEQRPEGQGVRTAVCELEVVPGTIHLDFNSDGRLIGVEILNARAILPPALLGGAAQLGHRP